MGKPAGRNHAESPLQKPATARSMRRCPASPKYHRTLRAGSLEECFDEGNSDQSHEEKPKEEIKR